MVEIILNNLTIYQLLSFALYKKENILIKKPKFLSFLPISPHFFLKQNRQTLSPFWIHFSCKTSLSVKLASKAKSN